MLNKVKIGSLFAIILLFASCGAYMNQPLTTQPARIGETSFKSRLNNISPIKPIEVGVYKFRDQTGQYKLVEGGVSYSTAVTQGATSILIKALDDSKWFTPIERENVSNLLNERQIIRSTRQEYNRKNNLAVDQTGNLPPLLFAGILLEGGIISYDTNMITGGAGARYFGAGASTQYRQDIISIYLRAVSTSNGKILKTVYISKTILSQAIDVSLFRYVNVKRLLEVETGVTQNEPAQMAVKEAIEKAVENLIIEGIIDGLWQPKGGQKVIDKIKADYQAEQALAESTKLLDRNFRDSRGKTGFDFLAGTSLMDGDYANPRMGLQTTFGFKTFLFGPNFNFGVNGSVFKLRNKNIFNKTFTALDANLEYIMLPYDRLSPYIFAGGGVMLGKGFDAPKLQYGLGLEYLLTKKIGFKVYGEQNVLFDDNLDNLVAGKRDDYYWRFGVGITLYLGQTYNRAKTKY
ncbi:hypothetical protein EGM88_06365 [Aureibaculum marinum]|uniref:Curli production assembly/transport component CsgG n=1 Tax=Aureibaculum marinum TaxID=2487930 RepID=A0A3N4NX33_9FLAO|nr:CsgG/HfaB family protein [Aureibaculum marinum]RPD98808.1 hypothetical protein EGM88_06365 [Aureibaculum marinum]